MRVNKNEIEMAEIPGQTSIESPTIFPAEYSEKPTKIVEHKPTQDFQELDTSCQAPDYNQEQDVDPYGDQYGYYGYESQLLYYGEQ